MEPKMTFMEINTRDICVDPEGQRDVNKRDAQFRRIMANYDWRLVQPVSVGRVNGRYWCYDGQMTIKVLKARNGGHDTLVMCRVVDDVTLEDLAHLFLLQRGTVAPLKLLDHLEVQANRLKDAEAITFFNVAEKNGFKVAGSQGPHVICAVAALWGEYKAFDDVWQFDDFLSILAGAWDGDPAASQSNMLKGLGLFMRTYRGRYDKKSLVRNLSAVSPLEIIRDAEADRTPGPRKYAVKILNVYNKGKHAKLPIEL